MSFWLEGRRCVCQGQVEKPSRSGLGEVARLVLADRNRRFLAALRLGMTTSV
jgi:hypothetical protein